MRQPRSLCRPEVAKAGGASTAGKTPYDVLGVPRHASDKAIRTAFRSAAKSHHPDLNSGNPAAEQHFRQLVAAYEVLKRPDKRAAYDRSLAALDRGRGREGVRRFAATAAVALVSGSSAALAIWLWVSLSRTNVQSSSPQASGIEVAEVSRSAGQQTAAADDSGGGQREDVSRVRDRDADALKRNLADDGPEARLSASSVPPRTGEPEPPTLSAAEWEQAEASGGLMAIWGFAVRHPDAPESELARKKLMALIDTAEDVPSLQVLSLVATEEVAGQAQGRLIRLGALAASKADNAVSDTPSAASLLVASADAANKVVNPVQQPAATKRPAAKKRPAPRQQRVDRRKPSDAQEGLCVFSHGRCIGRDPDATVRFMIQHDSSLVND